MTKLAVPVSVAADMLSVSDSRIWKLLAEGRIARVKVGRRTVIRTAELDRFLSELEGDKKYLEAGATSERIRPKHPS